jgi:choline dehydrogenase-like flavoprotein
MIVDSLTEREQPWEFCIIGSGPVGMALALEFEKLGHEVLVLESGGRDVDRASGEDSRAVLANPQTHAPMELAACRAFGGASWTWGGRCVPLDDIDFEPRAWVPNSDWPITHDDLRPWYTAACSYLQCGQGSFELRPERLPASTEDISLGCLERWSTEPRMALIFRDKIAQSRHITLSVNSTAVDLEFDADRRRAECVVVATAGRKEKVRARQIILAMGGVETTRFMLTVQRRAPSAFGGVDGPLGRSYMGHLSGKIANILFERPSSDADMDFFRDATGAYVRRRFMLNAAAQRKHRVLNTAFFPDNPPFHDYRHHSGVLSAVFLALAFPPTGRRILAEGIRLAHIGSPPRHYGAHIRNVILGAPAGARDVFGILHDRFFSKPRKPGFLVRNSAGKYALHFHAEQEPSPESRIRLANETDRFGMPRAYVDLRYTDNDVASVVASHRVLDESLRGNGIGRLEYYYPEKELIDRVRAQASDGYHQTGSTRMGSDPRTSVVDSNLRVHGLDNLHVASSSVFRTTGQANSTLPAVALGLRLVHHLRSTA